MKKKIILIILCEETQNQRNNVAYSLSSEAPRSKSSNVSSYAESTVATRKVEWYDVMGTEI